MPPSANPCHKVSLLLSAFHDDELDAEEKKFAAAHLETCPACRQELAEITQLATMLKQAHQHLPGRDLVSELQFPQKKSMTLSSIDLFKSSKSWVVAAATLLILVMVYADLSRRQRQQPAHVASAPATIQHNHKIAARKPEEVAILNQSSMENKQVLNPAEDPQKEATHTQDTFNSKKAATKSTHKLPSPAVNDSAEPFIIASAADEAEDSMPDILGIATDEDGLYDLKI